jgi:hypothetical protein
MNTDPGVRYVRDHRLQLQTENKQQGATTKVKINVAFVIASRHILPH